MPLGFWLLAKPFGGIQLIAVGEVLYWFLSKGLCVQFCDFFLFICWFINLKW
jgi:hypothetical protein